MCETPILSCWCKILIGQWRCDGTLNANKRLVGPRVAAIAATGKLVEGDRKFGAALCANRHFKLVYPRIDDCLDHLGDRNALKGGAQDLSCQMPSMSRQRPYKEASYHASRNVSWDREKARRSVNRAERLTSAGTSTCIEPVKFIL
jgi:hypothetical protein